MIGMSQSLTLRFPRCAGPGIPLELGASKKPTQPPPRRSSRCRQPTGFDVACHPAAREWRGKACDARRVWFMLDEATPSISQEPKGRHIKPPMARQTMTTNLIIGTNSLLLNMSHARPGLNHFMSHVRAGRPSDALECDALKVDALKMHLEVGGEGHKIGVAL